MKATCFLTAALAVSLVGAAQGASWFERLGFGGKRASESAATIASSLTEGQIADGLKAALSQGLEQAISRLGRKDGFLSDLKVRIPLPAELAKGESVLRLLRQDKLADEFVVAMNRAAEKAVPEAAAILGQSIQQMTLADARAILTSTNNAATAYFRRTSETNLFARFQPIVREATEQAGVIGAYKALVSKAKFAAPLLGEESGNLDAYITQKALDGLFLKIAEEEKRIRENPSARATELVKQVFGSLSEK